MFQFSTINESSLHNTIKKLYALQNNGETEVEKLSYVYDVLCGEKEAIEIQTQNLGKLLKKVQDSIANGLKIKVVYPLVISKTILLLSENDEIISKRKSPKKGCIYDIFKELTGLYPILLNKNFTLEILEINITEFRIHTENAVQSKNKKRRFKRNWNKTNKKLDEILNTKTFSCAEDYLKLLPASLPEEFSVKDLENSFRKEKTIPSRIYKNANLIVWIYNRMNLITQTGTKGKARIYKISK